MDGFLQASSSCDGTARVWSLETSVGQECTHLPPSSFITPLTPPHSPPHSSQDCVKVLPILPKCSDVSLVKSLCYLAWHPKGGKVQPHPKPLPPIPSHMVHTLRPLCPGVGHPCGGTHQVVRTGLLGLHWYSY